MLVVIWALCSGVSPDSAWSSICDARNVKDAGKSFSPCKFSQISTDLCVTESIWLLLMNFPQIHEMNMNLKISVIL